MAAEIGREEIEELGLYLRVHHADCPEFSPENAKSVGWGAWALVEDGEVEPLEGYSCCETPEELVDYFENRAGCEDDARVVAFSGWLAGYGCDGEPLVVPDMRHVYWMTYRDVKEMVS